MINAWWPLVFYPATDAPRFHKGTIAMICVSVATLGVTGLVWYLERRENREKGSDSKSIQSLQNHNDDKEGMNDHLNAKV